MLATPRLTAKEALNEAHRFVSQWTRPKTPEYFDWVAEVFQAYPAAIIRELIHPLRGIGRTPHPKGGPRLYPPDISEITDWCDARVAELTRALDPPQVGPAPLPVRSPEDIAFVRKKLKEVTSSLTRAMGGKSPEEKLTEAQLILERYEREAKDAALAAKTGGSPPNDGAHAARALADLETRRHSPFDDPDM
jgi:hypothetical protein